MGNPRGTVTSKRRAAPPRKERTVNRDPYRKDPPEPSGFGSAGGEKPVNRNEVKKKLAGLFGPKAEDRCKSQGHAWVRDRQRRTVCATCGVVRES